MSIYTILVELVKIFYNKIKSIDLANVTSIRINTPFSMNIGIYSQSIINNFEKFFIKYKKYR